MICPHRSDNPNGTIECAILRELAGATQLAGPGRPNHPCTRCQAESPTPPTVENLPPSLLRILGASPVTAKPWDYSQPCRGLGDLVAKGLRAVGIKQRPGCGCAKRQERLNRAVPFRRA